ncbi:hypothetical protein FXW78_05370 [Rhodococcus opacus]|nr:hypothetical protein [Rhodococcus opacus]
MGWPSRAGRPARGRRRSGRHRPERPLPGVLPFRHRRRRLRRRRRRRRLRRRRRRRRLRRPGSSGESSSCPFTRRAETSRVFA